MSRLPAVSQPWLRRNKWVVTAVASAVVVIGSAAAALRGESDYSNACEMARNADQALPGRAGVNLAWAVLAGTFVSGLLAVWMALIDSKSEQSKTNPAEVFGCCLVLRNAVAFRLSIEDQPSSIRVTVYRVCSRKNGKPQELERVTPYAVGPGLEWSDPGVRLSSKCGVVGLAARTAEVQLAVRQAVDLQEFRASLVREWGFDTDEARRLNETRWAWLAIPLKDRKGRVDTVVYLDSSEKDAFSPTIRNEIYSACEHVGALIDWRYGDAK